MANLYVKYTLFPAVLEYVDIFIYSEVTYFQLHFNLTVNSSLCDTTQIYLQTLNGVVTFKPLYNGQCEPNYDEPMENDNILKFQLHPNDLIRLFTEPYNQLITTTSAIVSIGTNLVHTPGNIGVTPVYFTDQMNIYIYKDFASVSILSFHLDLINAEFHIEFSQPVISHSNYVAFYCDNDHNETAIINGIWSTGVSLRGTATIMTLRMTAYSFAMVCSLSCLEDDYLRLNYFSPFVDVFGSEVASYQYQNSFVRKIINLS